MRPTFGERLKHLRQAAGWTQQQLAERAGLVQSNVSHLERGEREPSWEVLGRLADALGVRLDAFRPDE